MQYRIMEAAVLPVLSCLVCAVDGREGERDRPGRDALARHIGGDQLDRFGGFLAVVQAEHDCGVRFGKALRSLGVSAGRRALFVPGVQRRVPQAVACGRESCAQPVDTETMRVCTPVSRRSRSFASVSCSTSASPEAFSSASSSSASVCPSAAMRRTVSSGQSADLTGRKNAAVRPLPRSVSRTAAVFLSGAP